MPYSDRDNDSLYASSVDEQLVSPTDGYFTSREHPQDVYVNTTVNSETSKRDHDNSVESLLRSCLSSSSAFSGPHRTPSSSSLLSNETTHLLRSATPPPAYTSEVTQPSYPSYGTQQSSEQNRAGNGPPFFSASLAPQSMRDIEAESIDPSRFQNQDPWRRRGNRVRFIMKIITSVGLLFLLLWVAMVFRGQTEPESPKEPEVNSA
jgi:hypothetical protein